MQQMPSTITKHFAELDDPRNGNYIPHKLLSVVVIAICAVICGADGWVDCETFGHAKFSWLEQFLDLSNGSPSQQSVS